ncbi:PIR Superfamily Protein [Plasmodium ovale wallikeri]|uniref:PIR Superfamily Protein n=1 Tax=Plasmodium ovale wallikeri TaxID=864142 RepID=A0A1A9AI22_PLAOA|nr:PIR Superfamily Protein [Plasmodium ovale wallikeri]SBT57283.1 PIR Superfamily Protein [Plasmodium ovale wallikeri]
MANNMRLEDLPSKKYNDELKNGIKYHEIEKNMEAHKLITHLNFWSTTFPVYLGECIDNHMDKWSKNNIKKRCRDLNHVLDFIIKEINDIGETNTQVSHNLIKDYINRAAETHLQTWGDECKRKSKLPDHSDYIEYMKKVDDLCEDTDYIKKRIPEMNSANCKAIENYITKQISELGQIYTTSDNNYSDILGYYDFTSFHQIDNIVENLKSKCQEVTAGVSLVGGQGGMQQYSGRNASIVAVTSLSGILSSALLLYKTTPFGSIMNNIIQKKIKFGNNLNEKIDYETLEEIPESSHNGAYNILYNTVGDS